MDFVFTQYLHVIAGTYLKSGHDRFLLRHFQLILPDLSYCLTSWFELLEASFRGAQILGAWSPGRLNFVRWRIITAVLFLAYKNTGPQYGTYFLSPFLCLEFKVAPVFLENVWTSGIITLSSSPECIPLTPRYFPDIASSCLWNLYRECVIRNFGLKCEWNFNEGSSHQEMLQQTAGRDKRPPW